MKQIEIIELLKVTNCVLIHEQISGNYTIWDDKDKFICKVNFSTGIKLSNVMNICNDKLYSWHGRGIYRGFK